MANGKRYYWLKLHDDFFSSKRIKKLRRMAGGDTYTIIYLKMQLKAMKEDGMLKWSGVEDSFAEELALDLDEEADNVRVTLAFLLKYGLAETSDEVNFFLPYAAANVGNETAAAERMRQMRERNNVTELCNNVTPMLQDRYGEKERDTREKKEDIEKREKPARHKYGDYGHVLLTDDELDKLKERFPSDWERLINNLDKGIELKGYKYKNHYLAILKWAEKDAPAKKQEPKAAAPTSADMDHMADVLARIKGGG